MNEGSTAASVMDPRPTTVKADDLVGTAAAYIMKHRYRNLPVIDKDGRYLGIFGVNCLLRLLLPKAAVMERGLDEISFIHESLADLRERFWEVANQPVSVCISGDVITVPPDKPLIETLLILYRTKTSIPVVDPASHKLLGMISYWDVCQDIVPA